MKSPSPSSSQATVSKKFSRSLTTQTSKYPANTQAHYLNNNFNYIYTNLLKALHLTFNGQPDRLDSSIAIMQHSMRELAMEMMLVPLGDGRNVLYLP